MVDKMKTEEKQQFIRDYYAFCAMGDSLIGAAVINLRKAAENVTANMLYLLYVVTTHGIWVNREPAINLLHTSSRTIQR